MKIEAVVVTLKGLPDPIHIGAPAKDISVSYGVDEYLLFWTNPDRTKTQAVYPKQNVLCFEVIRTE